MENEINRNFLKSKSRRYIIFSLCSAFVICYVIMAMLGPAKKINSINTEFGYKFPNNPTLDKRVFSDSAYVKINREKAYYQSRILMAETDSVCLALNLADSTAILEINGVIVHSAKISGQRISKVLRKADEYSVSSMLSTPFTIKRSFATIRKEPVILKMAPKDTSEYKPDILPDTTDYEPVHYMLEMENGFRLYIYQNTGGEAKGSLSLFFFDLKDRFRNTYSAIKSICVAKVPEYHPFIKIRLPKADAKIIYRAIPRQGQIAVFR